MRHANHPPAGVLVPHPTAGFVSEPGPGCNGGESSRVFCCHGGGVEESGGDALNILTGRLRGGLRGQTQETGGVKRDSSPSLEVQLLPVLLLLLILPSCVEFQASGGTTAAHYKGPPWGKVAYAKGDEMFTSDHDAGWIATVTAGQNIITTIGGQAIAGSVTKAITTSNNGVKINAANNATAQDLAAKKAATDALQIKSTPTVTTPPQVVTFPP